MTSPSWSRQQGTRLPSDNTPICLISALQKYSCFDLLGEASSLSSDSSCFPSESSEAAFPPPSGHSNFRSNSKYRLSHSRKPSGRSFQGLGTYFSMRRITSSFSRSIPPWFHNRSTMQVPFPAACVEKRITWSIYSDSSPLALLSCEWSDN